MDSFERNGWTCFTSPSTKFQHKTTFRAVRGEGHTRQVINVEILDSQVEDFDPQVFWDLRK